nr:ribonuclease H-like domain-containing protein [Tanacetum cinerariifolium]
MSLIHAFSIEDMYSHESSNSFRHTSFFKKSLVRTLPLKSQPHHQSQSQSRLEDAKRGRFKTRMHPGRLHGQMRKNLYCVKVGFTYPKAANLATRGWMLDFELRAHESGAGDEDYYNMTLLHYEVKTEVPFKLRHCWEVLNGNPKWMNSEVPNFLAKSHEGASSHLNSNVNNLSTVFKSAYIHLADGSLSRYKARLVANDSSQQLGIDCDETFSPVVKPATIPTVLSLALTRHWPIHQLDVKNAFLNGDLLETVYMHQPPDFVDPRYPHHVCRLQREFDMTDLGALNHFLGNSVTRDTTTMFLSQKRYAMKLLERAHMLNCNPTQSSVDTESKLGPEGTPISDPTLYRSLAESSLVAYSDADWAGCPAICRSTSGYCVFFGNNILSWSSKRQPTLSRSSVEAEYQGVANVGAETAWLRNLLRELHTPLLTATLVYCDNVSAIYLSANPVQHQRTKHIEIDIHFVSDMVAMSHVRVLQVPSRY